MGEEADPSDYDRLPDAVAVGGEGDEGRVLEWEIGLPSLEDLMPLSQPLIPPELASAFSISPESPRTMLDVHRASQNTFCSLRRHNLSSSAFKPFPSSAGVDPMILEGDDDATESFRKKARRSDDSPMEEDDSSAFRPENSNDDQSARSLKRPRLVWTPQLHKRFVDVVSHLGIKCAVPKTIMQLMNVEGLTRENVASHLQKYRLYQKRTQGLSNEEPSSSDHLFASTPVPQSLQESPVPMQLSYATPSMMPMPVFGVAHHHGHGGSMGIVPISNHHGGGLYHGFEAYPSNGVFAEQRRDWSGGNKFGSIVSYPHVTSNDK